ncbi:MAG: hypothetical protein IJI56_05335, partial [Firmicutes bacterium]|nr:hypothetical protein [Bacillota bacterium]
MKKGIALTLALLVAMVCVPTTFADTKKADLELQVLSEEYAELMEFHEEVEDLFPEVEITEIPSFEKFCYDSEKPYSKSERPTLIESLETEKNGIVYKLYMYDDDSVGLLSFRDGNLVTGVSDINGGNLRWRWWHASLTWHQVTVTLRVYGSSGNYYFDSPYMPTDVIATNVLPVSLYRGGS